VALKNSILFFAVVTFCHININININVNFGFDLNLKHISFSPFLNRALASTEVLAQEGEFLIKMKGLPNARKSQAFVGQVSGKMQLKATYGQLGIHYMKVKSGQDIQETLNELRQDPEVEYVEPNFILRLIHSPSESQKFSLDEGNQYMAQSWSTQSYNQTGNEGVKVTQAWSTRSESPNQIPIVAVIDSGVDYEHPVFKTKDALWMNQIEVNGVTRQDDDGNGYIDDVYGWNFIDGNNNPMDSDDPEIRSHGTHVAGIIVGVNQPLSSTTQSPVKVMALKFLGAGGVGSTSAAIQSIYYAVRNGAKVINMSWGGGAYSQALHDALAYAYQQGVILVAAAGNSTQDNDSVEMYPANFPVPSQLTVAAVNDWDSLASFSNFGRQRVHVSAPGVSVYSTSLGGYRILSGTSMAAPFVAGLAAMILSEKPELSGYQVRNLLIHSSDSLGGLVQKIHQGSRVQVLKTLLNAQSQSSPEGFQPPYESLRPASQRAPASSESSSSSMGGCGMVSSSLMSQWLSRVLPGSGSSGLGSPPQPSLVWMIALSLLPFILWQALRIQSQIVDYTNRRKHERFAMNSSIKVKVGDRELLGQMSTISAGGVSFRADTLLEKGGLVSLQIVSPDGQEHIEVQGRIVWSEENQAYGVQFAEEKTQIEDWSKHLTKAS
jgi:hypothetical protein